MMKCRLRCENCEKIKMLSGENVDITTFLTFRIFESQKCSGGVKICMLDENG